MEYCVLIPSYNEEKTIGHIVDGLRRRGITVYVVDDGSTDKTFEKSQAAGAIVVRHANNKGKGASLIEGFRHVIKKGFDAVVVMDGDNQHEVSSISDFLRKMEDTRCDMVIGSRMSDTSSMPFIRKVTNKFMSALISRMSGQNIPDTQCGFRLIKRRVLESISLESSNFEIESEIIIKAAKKGFKIESAPIKTVYKDEKSRINPFVDTLRFIIFVIRTSLSC